MEDHSVKKQFEVRQYRNQANLVYVGTIIGCVPIAGVFWFLAGSELLAFLIVLLLVVSGGAIWLNQKQRYGMASLVYIGLLLVVAVVEVLTFGLGVGFQYYFFNMAGLIIYTNWRGWQKFMGLFLEAVLLVVLYFMMAGRAVPVELGYGLAVFFHTVNVVLNIAGVANSAIYYKKIAMDAHEEITDLAMTDYLTGLLNRSAFDGIMDHFESDRRDSGRGVGLLLLDIDHFKEVNDTFGHLCGDEILRQLAGLIREHCRKDDDAARYGGEEFVVVARLDRAEDLGDYAERLRRLVEGHVFLYEGVEHRISVSIGALFVPRRVSAGRDEVLARADRLLYRAKEAGRNRVVFEALG